MPRSFDQQLEDLRRYFLTLDFIDKYIREHGHGPTVDEVAQSLGVSRNTVSRHTSRALREGRLVRTVANDPRTTRIV